VGDGVGDRVDGDQEDESEVGRGPSRGRAEDRMGDGPMTESMAGRGPSWRRAEDRPETVPLMVSVTDARSYR
jgi:hypothetical protein